MKENGFVIDNKAESPNTEARHGVRVLKGSVRSPYRFPVIDEYMKERPFVLEHFLSVAGDFSQRQSLSLLSNQSVNYPKIIVK